MTDPPRYTPQYLSTIVANLTDEIDQERAGPLKVALVRQRDHFQRLLDQAQPT